MNTSLMLRSGRNLKYKLWQKENKLLRVPALMHHIQIPPRIERGPLDILKALSSTVKKEKNTEEYRYQYGGLFILNTAYKKRLISLSQESGRKAAKWIVAENPTLFQHRSAEPYIEAFSPPETFDENSEVSEEILIEMIQKIKVTAAIKVYELLKEKGLDVSNSTKQQLLELVCFYNCNDKPDESLLEMSYFENPRTEVLNNWNSEGLSMKLFSEMEKNSETYSAVILGMFKYNNTTNAMALYKEAEDEGIKFDVDVYNALLENAIFETYNQDSQKEIILNLLNKMEKENIEPNVETLNNVLKSVLHMRRWFKSRSFAWSLYSELTRIGVKPSLATYYYLLEIFLDRKGENSILEFVLSKVEKEEFSVQHVDDFKFFPKAMEKCCHNYGNVSMAYRIHEVLNTGRNSQFLCKHFPKYIYYRSFLRTLFENENLDKALKIYTDLVPAVFLPDIGTLMLILKVLIQRNGISCLPRIWADIKKMTASDSEKIMKLVVSLISVAGSDTTKETDLLIAKEAWELIEQGKMRACWDSELASNFLNIFSRCGDKVMAYKAFDFTFFLETPSIFLKSDSLKMFLNFCIEIQDQEKALKCIEYSVKIRNDDTKKLIQTFKSGFKLEQQDLARLREVTTKKEEID